MLPEPPQNTGYMIAAYVVAGGILVGYWSWLWGKGRRVLRGEREE